MTTPAKPFLCMYCARFDRRSPYDVWRCEAFPKAIPAAILENEADHREPIEGDGGKQFKQWDKRDVIPFERMFGGDDD